MCGGLTKASDRLKQGTPVWRRALPLTLTLTFTLTLTLTLTLALTG